MKYEDFEAEYISEAKLSFSWITISVAITIIATLASPALLLWVSFFTFIKVILTLIFLNFIGVIIHKKVMKIATDTAKSIAKKEWEKEKSRPTCRQRLEKMMKDAQEEQASRK